MIVQVDKAKGSGSSHPVVTDYCCDCFLPLCSFQFPLLI